MPDLYESAIPDVLKWRPKWWWDPIPPFLREELVAEIGPQLAKIQLEKQIKILEVQIEAMQQTAKLIGR